ncbi:MAG: hypothetical protein PV344_06120, partial [Anaplasma sp.]|nr:hypothetical protein [Anaplasma sp.]
MLNYPSIKVHAGIVGTRAARAGVCSSNFLKQKSKTSGAFHERSSSLYFCYLLGIFPILRVTLAW